jgi:osmotically-inducible protein OsmY
MLKMVVTESEIEQEVLRELKNRQLGFLELRVLVNGSVVTLRGTAPDSLRRRAAGRATQSVPRVTRVINEIVVTKRQALQVTTRGGEAS